MTPKAKYEASVEECRQTRDTLLSWQMAAKILGLPEGYVGQLVQAGKIPIVDNFGGVRRVKLSAAMDAVSLNGDLKVAVTQSPAVAEATVRQFGPEVEDNGGGSPNPCDFQWRGSEDPCPSPKKGEVAHG